MVRIAVRTITLNCLKGKKNQRDVHCSERQEHREVHEPAQHIEVLQEAGLLRDFISGNHEQHGGIEVTHWQWSRFVAALLVLEKLATTSSINSYSCRMCSIFRCLA